MGTRGINGFIYKAEDKLCYNHFDSYPTGLGKQILKFIVGVNQNNDWDRLKSNVEKLKMIDADSKPTKKEIEMYTNSGFLDESVGKPGEMDWYKLLRNTQNGVWMDDVYEGTQLHAEDCKGLIKNSLFCEFGYIINLDTMQLEIYRGFQKKAQKGNRYGTIANDDGYYPCKLVDKYDLADITDESVVNDFIDKMTTKCEKE